MTEPEDNVGMGLNPLREARKYGKSPAPSARYHSPIETPRNSPCDRARTRSAGYMRYAGFLLSGTGEAGEFYLSVRPVQFSAPRSPPPFFIFSKLPCSESGQGPSLRLVLTCNCAPIPHAGQ